MQGAPTPAAMIAIQGGNEGFASLGWAWLAVPAALTCPQVKKVPKLDRANYSMATTGVTTSQSVSQAMLVPLGSGRLTEPAEAGSHER